MSIFTDEERQIFVHEFGWCSIFNAFEKIMCQPKGEEVLKSINDPNINFLIEASKLSGQKRICLLLLHALSFD